MTHTTPQPAAPQMFDSVQVAQMFDVFMESPTYKLAVEWIQRPPRDPRGDLSGIHGALFSALRDGLWAALSARASATPQPQALPELPEPELVDQHSYTAAYTTAQMHAYARAALASQPPAPAEAGRVPSTPSSHWKANGEPDPHDSGYYDQQRARLCMGELTDDELANGAFMNYDRHPSVAEMVAGKPTPIVWMTAVKDRIRWLSRALEKALASQPPAPADPWRLALDDRLVNVGLDCIAPDEAPDHAIKRLIEWETAIALDPGISEAAQALIEQGRANLASHSGEVRLGKWFRAESVDDMQRFYRSRLPAIREAARELGYAIGVHGSERRDFDLIACPWREGAADHDTLAHAIAMAACGITREGRYDWTQKPLGRVAVSIPVCWTSRRDVTNDGHIDLSIAPATPPPSAPVEPQALPELPALPKPYQNGWIYTAAQMHAYACAALASQPPAPAEAGRVPSTPSSHWKANGEPDPHDARHYDQERATLCMGDLTDDELANLAFMNYDRHPSVAEMAAGKPTPMVWMTAVKDRIRWLSRALEKALATQPPSPQTVSAPEPAAAGETEDAKRLRWLLDNCVIETDGGWLTLVFETARQGSSHPRETRPEYIRGDIDVAGRLRHQPAVEPAVGALTQRIRDAQSRQLPEPSVLGWITGGMCEPDSPITGYTAKQVHEIVDAALAAQIIPALALSASAGAQSTEP